MELREGQLITPNLRLRRLLGQGGMGSVWLADHQALQSQVAIKFLSSEFAASAEAIERFKREATAAAQIRSPHVVQTLDHGVTENNTPFIVLELLEGEELGARLEREPQLPLPLVVQVVNQTCKALQKAHDKGVIHRDIKPDNLFLVDVDGEPFVKVLDFGIAKQANDKGLHKTATNTMIGTPYYMSPEQALSSKDVDLRTDLWALAVVAYQALTGRIPFDGETLGAICVAIERANPPAPSTLRPDLPPGIDAFFSQALARDISKRFSSARGMADAFALAAGEEPGPRSRVAPSGNLPRTASAFTLRNTSPSPSRPRWPLIAGVGAVIALAAGGLLVANRSSAPPLPGNTGDGSGRAAASITREPAASAIPGATAVPVAVTAAGSASATGSAVPAATATGAGTATTGATAATGASTATGAGKQPGNSKAPGKTPPEGKAPPDPPSKPAAQPTEVDRGF